MRTDRRRLPLANTIILGDRCNNFRLVQGCEEVNASQTFSASAARGLSRALLVPKRSQRENYWVQDWVVYYVVDTSSARSSKLYYLCAPSRRREGLVYSLVFTSTTCHVCSALVHLRRQLTDHNVGDRLIVVHRQSKIELFGVAE